MVAWNRLRPFVLAFVAYVLYTFAVQNEKVDNFVPFNAFEVPQYLKPQEWQMLNDKFGNLVQLTNTTNFSVATQTGSIEELIKALDRIINSIGTGRFNILSIGSSLPLTLTDVVVQDVDTLAVTKFSRVDFVVESTNPYIIHKVIVTPDPQFVSSQKVVPQDALSPKMFRIKNPLHLFYPYATSDDDMRLTAGDETLFRTTVEEKADQMLSMSSTNAVNAGTVAMIPATTLPTAETISKQIVGAGPLHPIGL